MTVHLILKWLILPLNCIKLRHIIHVFQGNKKKKTHILFVKENEIVTDNNAQYEGFVCNNGKAPS